MTLATLKDGTPDGRLLVVSSDRRRAVEAGGKPPIPQFDSVPVMYQGASDDCLGPCDDVPLPMEADGIDFEDEFGVITGAVPMGVSPAAALRCIRRVVQLNYGSLRALGLHEMKTGFGVLQAKPSTGFAPVAVTPDELGDARRDGRVQMRLHVQWNGRRFGEPHDQGEIRTGFMRFGDRVRLQACFDDGRAGPFGVIEQKVVPC